MTDNRAIFELLTPPEIAICLRADPTFTLPAGVPFASMKMRAARQILRSGFYDPAEVERELAGDLLSVWRESVGLSSRRAKLTFVHYKKRVGRAAA